MIWGFIVILTRKKTRFSLFFLFWLHSGKLNCEARFDSFTDELEF